MARFLDRDNIATKPIAGALAGLSPLPTSSLTGSYIFSFLSSSSLALFSSPVLSWFSLPCPSSLSDAPLLSGLSVYFLPLSLAFFFSHSLSCSGFFSGLDLPLLISSLPSPATLSFFSPTLFLRCSLAPLSLSLHHSCVLGLFFFVFLALHPSLLSLPFCSPPGLLYKSTAGPQRAAMGAMLGCGLATAYTLATRMSGLLGGA